MNARSAATIFGLIAAGIRSAALPRATDSNVLASMLSRTRVAASSDLVQPSPEAAAFFTRGLGSATANDATSASNL